jgi:hypothetical protein
MRDQVFLPIENYRQTINLKAALIQKSLGNRFITHRKFNCFKFILSSGNFKRIAVHYLVHKTPPLNTILRQFGPVHTLTPCFFNICLDFILHLPLGLPSGHFHSKFFPPTIYIFVIYSIRATCPAHISTIQTRICVYMWEEVGVNTCFYFEVTPWSTISSVSV